MDVYVNYFAIAEIAVSRHTYQNTLAHCSLRTEMLRAITKPAGNYDMFPDTILQATFQTTSQAAFRFGWWSFISAVDNLLPDNRHNSVTLDELYIRESCG